ncbi:acyl-CoA dehydrogenase family protein [Paenibacillus mucilaginosus]|uniref:Acyl-CoA dehydrogenase type 2 domain-containing protein n=2 Tax=Paenibacillus mucilaginosus TaxID=61624 RepID=H6NND1_9BACL|nr:acyl-CoA dehydrogenase family protein [Paenibacillus mucilaginosus]AFC32510.1 acyl-CoA dehydrogenase type 2 domain-containing protein [Paenibacillus mucilaginosus 3016]AFH64829.1 acyl-CoA dehydrogenase [Paenibacillus mucilaginosus K02]MCG7214800.1 acyl-CoA/acyl-ACP dehydrogenase [Paenibacillus mucilaginosus]WDM26285.1 acyl-CoA/acyl-ACP dehydrogenase [Paenibacillus mucilaginosus]
MIQGQNGWPDRWVRSEREAAIASRSERLAAVFAERAPKHDEEGSFPFDNFADLRADGYLALTVPREFGGEEASLYELVLGQERLARGDGSTALAVGWHLVQLFHLRYTGSWPEALFASFCREVVEHGALTNLLATEPSTGSPSRGGRPATTARRTDGGWLLHGRKTFSTLSPILQQFTVTAAVEGTEDTGEFFVRRTAAVRVEETWNTLGMRATGSHDVVLEGAFVPDDEVIRLTSGVRHPAEEDTGWLLHIPACYLGIAWAARDWALDYALTYAPNSLNGPISELPHIRRQIGEMEAEWMTARTLLYTAADRWDADPDGRLSMKGEIALAKYTAVNAAQRIVDLAMRIVGGASLSRRCPLERLYRDVRAGLHNPPMDDIVIAGLAARALAEREQRVRQPGGAQAAGPLS